MPAALTARRLETLKPGKTRREIPDGYLPGLYLIVQPSGERSWAVRYRHHRRPRKLTLGKYPVLDLKAAREHGAKALRAVAEGIDPARYAALSGRALDPRRIAVLREQGAIVVDENGRLRVTPAGFPVLDAVVADLAA